MIVVHYSKYINGKIFLKIMQKIWSFRVMKLLFLFLTNLLINVSDLLEINLIIKEMFTQWTTQSKESPFKIQLDRSPDAPVPFHSPKIYF